MAGPQPAGEHDLVGFYAFTVIGYHTNATTVLDDEVVDASSLVELGATLTSTLYERLGDIGRADRSIFGKPDAAHDVVDVTHRELLDHLGGRDLFGDDAEIAGHRRGATQLFPTALRAGKRYGARVEEAGCLAGLFFERLVELEAVLGETGEILRRSKLSDETRRVPGGASGQFVAFEDGDVGATEFGQVIGNRRADDAATHDDNLRTIR